MFQLFQGFTDRVTLILTWGGLRGAISVATALSLPPSPYRDVLISMTYIVVVFSILVQGLTIERLYELRHETKQQNACCRELGGVPTTWHVSRLADEWLSRAGW